MDTLKQIVANVFETHDFGMKWSYAEMAVTIEGLGLDWALRDLRDCISKLAEMSGHSPASKAVAQLQNIQQQPQTVAKSAIVTSESADFLLSVADQSADAIIFDPPYYDNVSYAELSDFFYVWLKRTAGLHTSRTVHRLPDRQGQRGNRQPCAIQ